jgi:hypothetical protein
MKKRWRKWTRLPDDQAMEERVGRFREQPRFVATGGTLCRLRPAGAVGHTACLFLVAQQTQSRGPHGVGSASDGYRAAHSGTQKVGIGVAAGVVCSLAVARISEGTVVGVTPGDPVLIAAIAVLAVTAAVAAWLPSRRAARWIDGGPEVRVMASYAWDATESR